MNWSWLERWKRLTETSAVNRRKIDTSQINYNRNFIPENILAATIQKTSTRKVETILVTADDAEDKNTTKVSFGERTLITFWRMVH